MVLAYERDSLTLLTGQPSFRYRLSSMANFLKPEKVQQIADLAKAGLPINAISRESGVASRTVQRYYPYDRKYLCACGQPAGHQGWCKVRYALSELRQAAMPGTPSFKGDATAVALRLNERRQPSPIACLRCSELHDGRLYRGTQRSERVLSQTDMPVSDGRSLLCQRCQHEIVDKGSVVALLTNDLYQMTRKKHPPKYDNLWRTK